MDYPRPVSGQTVIEKYGRKVELVDFTQPHVGHPDARAEWLLFKSDKHPVIVFPIDIDGNVVAVRQYRYGSACPIVELPGGLMEDGEDWTTCAIRELREEAGHSCEMVVLVEGAEPYFDCCCYNERFKVAVAIGCKKIGEPTEPYCEIVKVPVEQWYRSLNECQDAKTIAVAMLVLRSLAYPTRLAALRGLGE